MAAEYQYAVLFHAADASTPDGERRETYTSVDVPYQSCLDSFSLSKLLTEGLGPADMNQSAGMTMLKLPPVGMVPLCA